MRSGRWKLHFPHKYRTMKDRELGKGGMPGKYNYSAEVGMELYDLAADIGESKDVAAQHPEVVKRLTKLADEMRAELGDQLTKVEGSGTREPGLISD